MPNKNYNNGRRREYFIKHKLEAKNLLVLRTRGSHSPFDLIAIDTINHKIYFLQVKPKKFSHKATNRLNDTYKDMNDEFIGSFQVVSRFKDIKF
jgi:hypothetical protein